MSSRGSLITPENWGDALDPRIQKWFWMEYEENIKESMIPMLYNMMTTQKNYEMMSGAGALSDFERFDGSLAYDTPSQLYDTTVYFPERALGLKITRKMYDDDESGIMSSWTRQLAIAASRTREKLAAEPFNNAFVANTTDRSGGDGVALCSSSHPYSPDDATTQSNAGSTALSATSIEATRRIGKNSIYNDRGDILSVNYDLILCDVSNEETAYEIINSSGKVDTANNNRNFHYGRYELAIWDRLTSTTDWFMLDKRLMKLFNIWYDRVKTEFNKDQDFDTYQTKWSGYFRCNYVQGGWPWIYGHNV